MDTKEQGRDGGQAFPMHERDDALRGMSLRDYFAAKAMTALVIDNGRYFVYADNSYDVEPIARDAYLIADAMLKAKAEGQPDPAKDGQ